MSSPSSRAPWRGSLAVLLLLTVCVGTVAWRPPVAATGRITGIVRDSAGVPIRHAGGAGLRLAYDVAKQFYDAEGNNRVILATDGDFNVGESSDAAMIRLIEERRDGGVFLTVLGFGTGNLKDS